MSDIEAVLKTGEQTSESSGEAFELGEQTLQHGEKGLDRGKEALGARPPALEPDEREPAAGVGDPEEDEELDPEVRERRDRALAQVRKLGDPVLRAKALPVERFDAALAAEVQKMGVLMADALGIGLAATQIGVLHRVLVYRTDPEDPVVALVNPVLEWCSEETESAEEGCLSIPGARVDVERPARIAVRAQDVEGEWVRLSADGLEARVIQHELDHLEGVLILDRISREQRRQAMKAVRRALEEDA